MALEPVKFKCDGCNQVSDGSLDFRYETTKHYRGQWMLYVDHEFTNGTAKCENCGKLNSVWPRHHQDLRWERNDRKK